MKNKLLFDRVFENPDWKGADAFPSSERWKQEINRWLIYIKEKKQLNRYKPRLNARKAQRDEALAEIFSAYYMETIFGYEIIRWEEKTNGNRDVDFVANVNSSEIFCEVKSPGWESELSEEERLSGRKDQPKYIQGEARWYTTWAAIRYAIEKSYPKFLPEKKNMVILCDDLIDSPLDNPDDQFDIDIALFNSEERIYDGKGCFVDRRFENIGGVLFLNVRLSGEFERRHHLAVNQNSKKQLSLDLQETALRKVK